MELFVHLFLTLQLLPFVFGRRFVFLTVPRRLLRENTIVLSKAGFHVNCYFISRSFERGQQF